MTAQLEAYRHWHAVQIKSPDRVGTVEYSPGRFGDCGACAKVPDFADPGMTAMRQRAREVLMVVWCNLDRRRSSLSAPH